MAFSFKRLTAPLIDLLYPPLCLHCQQLLSKRGPLFCAPCLEHVELIPTENRCRTCFALLYKGRCERCIHRRVVIRRQMAACEAMGPAASLLSGFYQGKKEVLPGMASTMAYQWLEQKNALPDLIIPLPGTDKEMTLLLAQELGQLFSVPVASVLKQCWDREHFFTQGGFRTRLSAVESKGEALCDRRLLLIAPLLDDLLLRKAGEELKLFFPSEITALAFGLH